MPFVRIDLARGKTEHYRRAIGDVVYDAMVATMNVPANDRFQIIAEHSDSDFIIDRTYLGVERSDDVVVIQVTLNAGRTVEMKRAFYKAVADGLNREFWVAPRGCVHKSCRDRQGKLVVRQWRSAIRLS